MYHIVYFLVEARHAAYLNGLGGLPPSLAPFDNATVPAVIISLITPLLVSCPFTLTLPVVPYIGSSSYNGSVPTSNNTAVSPYTNAMYVNDLRVLNFALVAEQLESTFYNTYANFIRNLIIQRGGTPVPLCTYNFNVTSVLDFVNLSRIFENTGVSAYDGAINRISDPNLISGAATIATIEGRFASFVNQLTGNVPFPNVTDQALNPDQVVAVLSAYQTCPFTPDLPVLLIS